MNDMSKGSGGTKSTNSNSAHGGIGSSIKASVSNLNSMKLDSAQAFQSKHSEMTRVLGKLSSGSQIDFTKKQYDGSTYKESFVKDKKGTFVQKSTADAGYLESHFDKWTSQSISNGHVEYHMEVKKYNGKK